MCRYMLIELDAMYNYIEPETAETRILQDAYRTRYRGYMNTSGCL